MTVSMHLDEQAESAFLAHCVRRRFRKAELIIHAGASSHSLYYVVKGSVEVVLESADGKEMIVACLGRGEFIGELGVFYPDAVRMARVRARCDSEIAEISYPKFHRLAEQQIAILYAVGRQLASRLVTTTRAAADLAFMDVNGRIEQLLLRLARQEDGRLVAEGVQVRYTRQELAKMAGCSREVAGRALKVLVGSGRIEVNGKAILVKRLVLESPER